MKRKTFFKIIAISSVFIITGGILVAYNKTKKRVEEPKEPVEPNDTSDNYIFGDFSVPLPEYFVPIINEQDPELMWKFKNDDHTLLTIREGFYQRTKITGDILETIYKSQKEMYKTFKGPKPIFSTYDEQTDLIYYSARVALNDDTKARTIMAIYVLEDRVFMINLLSGNDAQSDYSDDFINIMTHVKRINKGD